MASAHLLLLAATALLLASTPSLAALTKTVNPDNGVIRYVADLPLDIDMESLVSTYVDTISSNTAAADKDEQRVLALGDFERFNTLFGDARLSLPPAELGSNGIEFNIRNLYCTDMNLGDLQTNYTILPRGVDDQQEVLAYTVHAFPFAMNCYADYDYKLGFLVSGEGTFTAETKSNKVETRIDLASTPSFELAPPATATVQYCNTRINTDGRVEFNGDVVAIILNVFRGLISDLVDDMAANKVCELLTNSGPDLFASLLNKTNTLFDDWLAPVPDDLADPLFAERNYTVPDGVALLNFQNSTDETVGDLFVGFLTEGDALFGDTVVDEVTGESDLGINVFLRDSFLDENGTLVLAMDNVGGGEGGGFDPVIYDKHGNVTQTKIAIEGIQIIGLDSLKSFNAFENIGEYTIGNKMVWERLSLELDLFIDVKTSTLPTAVLVSPDGPAQIQETIKIAIDFTDLDVNLSVFMAINQERFNDLKLGSVLDGESVLPCFLSAMEALEVSGLEVLLADMSDPILSGFAAPGIDRIVSELAEAAFRAYEPTLLRAMPGIFQSSVREMIMNRVSSDVLTEQYRDKCPTPAVETVDGEVAFLDFRDLFLDPDEATALGASGEQQYGTIGPMAYEMIVDRFSQLGDDGLPMVNEIFVRPFTETQSGVEGLVRFPNTLFELGGNESTSDARALAEELDMGLGIGFNFSLGDIRISNIDTIVAPLDLLVITDSPSVLGNKINMGNATGRPLGLALRMVTGLDGSVNEIDITATVDSINLAADLNLLVDANSFLQFPLGDILDFNCWLAALPNVELDSDGFAVDSSATRGLSLEQFAMAMSSFSLQTECVACTTPGTDLLPELLQILEEAGAIAVVGDRVPPFVENLARGDTMKIVLDRLVAEAPRFCPSSPEYNKDAVKTEYGPIGFPSLSAESIDTLLFSGLMVAQVAFVAFAESQRLKEGSAPSDPLSAQAAFKAPEGMRLLDWTAIGNSTGLGSIADQVFNQARQLLNSDDDSGIFDFEKIITDLLGDDGVLELETGFSFEQGGIALSLDSVRVSGLDTFALFDVLEPIAAQTVTASAQFDDVNLELVLSADNPSSTEPPQILTALFSLQNVTIDVAMFAAFDLDRIGALELGSLLDISSLLSCILSTAHAIEIPQMRVSIGAFSDPVVDGLMADTERAADSSLAAVFGRFRPEIEEAIPKIFDGIGKEFVSGWLSSMDDGTCESATLGSSDVSFVDFRDLILPEAEAVLLGGSGQAQYGNLISTAFEIIKDELFVADPDTGLAVVNSRLLAGFLEGQSGTPGRLFFEGDLFNKGQSIRYGGINADVRLRAYDAYVNNLDTFGVPLVILDPLNGEPHMLNNSASIGLGRPLQLGLRFFFSLNGGGTNIENDMDISLDLNTLQLLLTALAKVSENAFLGFPIRDLTDLQCWLATMPAPELDSQGVRVATEATLALTEFMASVSELGFNITCIDCSSPRMLELSDLLSSSMGTEDVTAFANTIFDFVAQLIEGNFFQVTADRALNNAKMRCPHSAEYDPEFDGFEYEPFEKVESEESLTFFLALLIVGACLLSGVLLVVLFTKLIVGRRHRKWIASLPRNQAEALFKQQHEEDSENEKLDSETSSMFRSDSIPLWLRLFMPLVILGNIGFFLSGHLSLGGSVTIMASFAGQTFKEDNFFEFSMAKSTIEIWKAGGQELAILIFIFSFVWPYSKQIVTLGLWFAPTSMVSVAKRGSVLLWLDVLAKWSMIDVFVLVITIVSFRISIQSPNVDFLPPDFYSIDLLVVPKWGLYANMTAQIISQLSSHFIIHYHRRIVHVAQEQEDIPGLGKTNTVLLDDEEQEIRPAAEAPAQVMKTAVLTNESLAERLSDHAFTRPHRGESDKLVVRGAVNPLLLLLSVCLCILVIFGCVLPSFSLEALGIVGVLVESGQQFVSANTEYSVFTTIQLLFEQARLTGGAANFIGLGTLSVLLILSVLIIPVLQSLVLLVQWFVPLTRKRRHRLSVGLEVLQAWQYAEVYLLAILVGSWQLGPISEFMINPFCRNLDGFFSEMVFYGILKAEDAQCFRADVSVEPTFYVLFAAAIALAIANTFVMKAVAQYSRDKDALHRPRTSEGCSAEYLEDLSLFESAQNQDALATEIHPVPVLFTDRFRWFLRREDATMSRQLSSSDASVQMVKPQQNEDVLTSIPGGKGFVSRSSTAQSEESLGGPPTKSRNEPQTEATNDEDDTIYNTQQQAKASKFEDNDSDVYSFVEL